MLVPDRNTFAHSHAQEALTRNEPIFRALIEHSVDIIETGPYIARQVLTTLLSQTVSPGNYLLRPLLLSLESLSVLKAE